MDIHKKYVVYEMNQVMGSANHLALQRVEFKGWKQNRFETEEEAVSALVEDGKSYESYLILREIYIN